MTEPVYPAYFADPFVLRHDGAYYAYGTGPTDDDRAFPVLRSEDLRQWVPLGGALDPPERGETVAYWAPEVALAEGVFHMYYSAGNGDEGHTIRVATSHQPEGPMRDLGRDLTPDLPFAIDPHPFHDRDGTWYLFYARDFLDGDRVGTGLEVDRLVDMTRLAGNPQTVLRASSDWQIYQRNRHKYGREVDWHTREGPFVVERGGRSFCFVSGGNWQNDTYGISYAVADHPLGPWSEPRPGGPAVLATVPGRLIGPGHNSVVVGPEGADRLVFHAWNGARTARQMYVEPLAWGAGGPVPRI